MRFGLKIAGFVAVMVVLTAMNAAQHHMLAAITCGITMPAFTNSVAGVWPAAREAVEIGRLFAWCQSVAMGGAALNGILAAGAADGDVLLGLKGLGLAMEDGKVDERVHKRLMELFRSVCRRVEGVPAAA